MGKYSDALLGAAGAPPPSPVAAAAPGKYSTALGFGAAPAAEPEKPKREVSYLESLAQGFIDTQAFNYGDESEAWLRSTLGGEDYDAAQADVLDRTENADSVPYYIGAGLGLIGPAGIAAAGGKIAKAAAPTFGRLAEYLGGAAVGAVEGGIAGAGAAEGGIGERLEAVPAGMALGAAGGAAGTAVGQGLTRLANRYLPPDISRLDPTAVAELMKKAETTGIDLTPAELTNLPSLKGQQKAYGNLVQTSDDLGAFYENRAQEQIAPAVEQFMDFISPSVGLEDAAARVRKASKKGQQNIAEERAAAASPLYQKAFDTAKPVDTSGVLATLDDIESHFPETGQVQKQMRKVRRMLQREVTTPRADGTSGLELVPETRLDILHGTKLELDDLIEAAEQDVNRGGGKTALAQLIKVKEQLEPALDGASRDYRDARKIFRDMSPGVDQVREGVAGVIANLPDRNLRHAAAKLFGRDQVGPEAALKAKEVIQRTDPDAWQAVKRAFLEEEWLKAGKETLDGENVKRGATWRKALFGDKRQRRILEAVLEPKELSTLDELSEVLEAAGRVKPVGSDTAWNQEMMKIMRAKSSPLVLRMLKGIDPNILRNASEGVEELLLARNAKSRVAAITNVQGIGQIMDELKGLDLSAQFKRAVIGHAMTGGLVRAQLEQEQERAQRDEMISLLQENPELARDPRVQKKLGLEVTTTRTRVPKATGSPATGGYNG